MLVFAILWAIAATAFALVYKFVALPRWRKATADAVADLVEVEHQRDWWRNQAVAYALAIEETGQTIAAARVKGGLADDEPNQIRKAIEEERGRRAFNARAKATLAISAADAAKLLATTAAGVGVGAEFLKG